MISYENLLKNKRAILEEVKKLHLDNIRIVIPQEDLIDPYEFIVSGLNIEELKENIKRLAHYLKNLFDDEGILVFSESFLSSVPNDSDYSQDLVEESKYKMTHNIPIASLGEDKHSFKDYFSE